jgi:hypothetical protein
VGTSVFSPQGWSKSTLIHIAIGAALSQRSRQKSEGSIAATRAAAEGEGAVRAPRHARHAALHRIHALSG